MKIFYSVVALIAVVVFSSCEGKTTFTKYVDNQSGKELTVSIVGGEVESYNRSFVIPSGEKKTIYLTDETGAKTSVPNCLNGFDSLVITFASDTAVHGIAKSPNMESNWTFNQSKQSSSKIHNYCTFSVAETDL
jgi:hypothetical protein